MTYQLLKDHNGDIKTDGIKRVKDGIISYVPNDMANRDWVEYQEWLAQGNEPEAAD